MWVFASFWVNFCIESKLGVQLHSPACGYSVVQASLVEKSIFFALSGLGTLFKIIGPEYKGLYLDFQFCSIDLFFGQHHSFDSCNFGVSSEIRKVLSSSFVLFMIVLWVSCISIGILGSVHQFLQKKAGGILMDCIDSVDQLIVGWSVGHRESGMSSQPWTPGTCQSELVVSFVSGSQTLSAQDLITLLNIEGPWKLLFTWLGSFFVKN